MDVPSQIHAVPGYGAADLEAHGLQQGPIGGPVLPHHLAIGAPVAAHLAVGASVADLLASGASVADLLASGASIADLLASGASVADLLASSASMADLLASGASVAELLASGASVADLLASGASMADVAPAIACLDQEPGWNMYLDKKTRIAIFKSLSHKKEDEALDAPAPATLVLDSDDSSTEEVIWFPKTTSRSAAMKWSMMRQGGGVGTPHGRMGKFIYGSIGKNGVEYY